MRCSWQSHGLSSHARPGQGHDLQGADVVLPEITAQALVADKAYDAGERVIEPLRKAGKTIVIPPKSNRQHERDYDEELHKDRHLIENFFAKLKQYRAITTRYDKRASTFLSAVYMAASIIWLN